MNLEERYLIHQTRKGNPEAFDKIYDKYLDRIYRFIFFRVSSKEQAEDLSSQVFLKALEYLGEKRKINNLQAFLYQIARNLIIDFYRDKKEVVSLDREEAKELQDGQLDISEKVNTKLEIEKIKKALTEIRDGYKEVIILYYLEELSIREIAQILEKNKGNVRILIHRALKALREKIR